MSAQTLWYVARASGIVAWLMLTASVLLGIVRATDLFPRRRRPAWLLDLHRWLASLTVFFLAGHLIALAADSQVDFGLHQIAVPFASSWRPTAVAAGVIAAWLLVAVEGTALAMKRLPNRLWRDVHVVSYWVFWATCIHAALAGTDASRPVYMLVSLAGICAVVFAASYRLLSRDLPKRTSRRESGRCAGAPAPVTTLTPVPARHVAADPVWEAATWHGASSR
jgi:methionine sulfoxide reductase heme-binding subunit